MNKVLFILLAISFCSACESSDKDKSSVQKDICSYIEDDIFREYCIYKFDLNNDGKVSEAEASAVTHIDLEGEDIRNLIGIEYFPNLKKLNCRFCEYLSEIDISRNEKITSLDNEAFAECRRLTRIILPNYFTSIGDLAFLRCSSLTSIVIPNSVNSIGNWAFGECRSLMSIAMPNSVTKIGESVFQRCSSLTNVTFGNSIISIGDDAFNGCSNLTNIVIPNSVTKIGNGAFFECSSLTSVTIGNSTHSIGNHAFNSCSSLTSVYCKAVTPPTGGTWIFHNNAPGRKIYVPSGSVSAYKSAWSDYSSDIVGYNF